MSIECHLYAVNQDQVQELAACPQTGIDRARFADAPWCNVHKAWHAIHFLLTGSPEEGSEPGCYLLHGGLPLGDADPDEMEDQPRLLDPDQVKAFNVLLQPLDEDGLRRRFDLDAMVDADVYSVSADYPDEEFESLAHFAGQLREFIACSAQADQGVVVSLG